MIRIKNIASKLFKKNQESLSFEPITIDNLSVKLFYKIVESGDLNLLPKNNYTDNELLDLWSTIYDEFQKRDDNQLSRRIFRISVDIEYLQAKFNLIIMCIDALRFDTDKELIALLKEHGYIINQSRYIESLDNAERNAKGIFSKIELLKSQLPKQTKSEKGNSTIDDVLAGYSSILGFNIGDFNKITCSEYLGWKKQVESKIKNQEKQIRELKSKRKNGR